MLHYRTAAPALSLSLILALVSGACTNAPTAPDALGLDEAASAPTGQAVGPLQAAPPHGNVGQPATRPMRLRMTVELVGWVDAPLAECPIGHFKSVIMGHATHLGKFSGVGSTCISTLEPDADPPFLPPGPPPYFTASFSNPRWVLTAASGDELWLEATDAVAVFGVNPQDGSFTSLAARGTHWIVGGAGRFAGATGELQTMAVNEDAQGPDDVRSEGWIRY
jgi:hypothetical protein